MLLNWNVSVMLTDVLALAVEESAKLKFWVIDCRKAEVWVLESANIRFSEIELTKAQDCVLESAKLKFSESVSRNEDC